MRAGQNLADVRSKQSFGTAAVDGSDSLAKIRPGEDSCSGVELRAHLPNRGSVATDDKHIRPHKHYRSEEHTSELQSLTNLVCRLLLEKKNKHRATSGS